MSERIIQKTNNVCYKTQHQFSESDKMPLDLIRFIVNDVRMYYEQDKTKYDLMKFSFDTSAVNQEQQDKLKDSYDIILLGLYTLLRCPCAREGKLTIEPDTTSKIVGMNINCHTKDSPDDALANLLDNYYEFEKLVNSNQDTYEIISKLLMKMSDLNSTLGLEWINGLGFKPVKDLYAYMDSQFVIPEYNRFDLENDDLGVLRAKLKKTYEDYKTLEHK